MSFPAEFDARSTGRVARRVLAGQRHATVIARFTRSIYVGNALGLACLGDATLGDGPLNVILDGDAPLPPVGATVRVDLGAARTWKPCAPPRPAKAGLARGLAALRGVRGRGLFPHLETDPSIAALRTWIGTGVLGRAPRAAAALIGRGPGLTPAGDDLVGGALVALRVRRLHARAGRLGRWAMRRARRDTNRISRAHLACAALGEGGAALHAFIAALLSGRRDVTRELQAIDAVGHTSGWDAAAGALLVLQCATPGSRIDQGPRSR